MQLRRFWLIAFAALLLTPFMAVNEISAYNDNDNNPVITLNKESYAAGETITVTGSVVSGSANTIIIQVISPNGSYAHIAQVTADSENNFSEDIATSIGGKWKASGTYIIQATHVGGTTQIQFEYGGLMQAQVSPSTDVGDVEDTNDFGLSSVDTLEDYSTITIEENDIFYKITGGKVLKIIPDTDSISLIIQIETFSDGDLLITLPKTIIDTTEGDFFVLVDGEETVFYAEQTPDSWTLRIPFYNGSEEIEIIGTFVIPEFGTIAAIILAVAITSIIVLSAKTKLSIMPKF
jgi:predicted secreted protein with PEFG-CTERM motif